MVTEEADIPQDVIDFFAGQLRVGYLATKRPDDHLAVVPVGVMIHEGKIRISSPSRTFKIRNLRHDPHVAICVPDPARPRDYLMIRGIAEVMDDTDRQFIAWLARTHMGQDDYPHESRKVARSVITVKAAQFVMPKVHGAD